MKLRMLFVFLAMPVLLLASACGDGADGEVEDFLKMLPSDAEGMRFVNMAELQEDGALRSFRSLIVDRWDGIFAPGYGIRPAGATYIAFSRVGRDRAFALGGLGGGETLRGVLQEGYEEKEIHGVEVWRRGSGYWQAFAFLPNGTVLATEYEELMEDLLRRRDRGTPSLYDEVSDVMSPLSTEIAMVVTPYCSFSLDCILEGVSFEKEGLWDFRMKQVLAFESENNAEDAHARWEPSINRNPNCYNEKLGRDGSRLMYEVVCDKGVLSQFFNTDFS